MATAKWIDADLENMLRVLRDVFYPIGDFELRPAALDDYPDRPVTVVAPYVPGPDVAASLAQNKCVRISAYRWSS